MFPLESLHGKFVHWGRRRRQDWGEVQGVWRAGQGNMLLQGPRERSAGGQSQQEGAASRRIDIFLRGGEGNKGEGGGGAKL